MREIRICVSHIYNMIHFLGIRSNVDVGNITYYDMLTALPFESRLIVTKLTGKDISNALEHSVHR